MTDEWDCLVVGGGAAGDLGAAAVVQSLLSEDVRLLVPTSPNQKETADVHA